MTAHEQAPPAELSCIAVTKSYGGRRVLDSVSVSVRRGEVHAVLGPSGSGKTTLLRILNLLEAPDAGSVSLGGTTIQLARPHTSLTDGQYRARLRMAMVFQKPVALHRTVFENAAFGLRIRGLTSEDASKRVRSALGRLGLMSLAEAQARRLSAGEQQRLAFARAAVLDVDFLLLDEFTANLDPANVQVLERAARAYAHEERRGVLLVTHDLFQARRLADRVTLLSDGCVVESAPRAQFFEAPADARTRHFLAGEVPL